MRRSSTPLALVLLVALVLAGGAAYSAEPATLTGPTYVVAPGDTLTGIADRAGVSVGQLASANHIADPNLILIGQVLTIPGRPAPAKAAAKSAAAATMAASGSSALAASSGLPAPGTVGHLIHASLDPTCHAPAAALAAAKAAHRSTANLPRLLRHRPRRLALRPCFEAWAATYHVSPSLVEGLAWLESGWQNDVVSSAAAYGIGQLTAPTIDFISQYLIEAPLDPSIPDQNIRMTARFIAYLLQQTGGDTAQAVAAYYQGLAWVRSDGPLPETKQYVSDVLYLAGRFGGPAVAHS